MSAHGAKSLPVARDAAGTGAQRHARLRPHWQLLRGQRRCELGNRRVRRSAARAGSRTRGVRRHPKPARSRHGSPWPRKRRMCTSRSGACRRASRSPEQQAETRRAASLHGQAPVRKGDRRRAAGAPSRGFARSGRGADPRPGSRARFGDERAGRAARGAAGNLPRRTEPGGCRSRSLRVWPRPARRPR